MLLLLLLSTLLIILLLLLLASLLWPAAATPHDPGRRLLRNDSLNHLLGLLTALLRSTYGNHAVHLTGVGLRRYLDSSVRRTLHVPDDATLSSDAESDILIWNLSSTVVNKRKSEKGRHNRITWHGIVW
jgi:hypothetical protein